MKPIRMVAGDNRPVISFQIANTSLAGYTVTYHLKRDDGVYISRAAEIIDVEGGRFTVTFESSDIVAGRHYLDFLLQSDAGDRFTLPVGAGWEILVREALIAPVVS